jgi:hypothetical protein
VVGELSSEDRPLLPHDVFNGCVPNTDLDRFPSAPFDLIRNDAARAQVVEDLTPAIACEDPRCQKGNKKIATHSFSFLVEEAAPITISIEGNTDRSWMLRHLIEGL